MKVLIPLAEGFEEIEAVTVIDLLRRAGIEVTSAGLEKGAVVASRGVVVIPDTELDSVLDAAFDMLVLPGGAGTKHLREDPRILSLVKRMNQEGKWVAAICAAPSVLAASGILGGRRATSFPGSLEACGHPNEGTPLLQDCNIVTSRGPGTAMDFALQLVEILSGREKRKEVEEGLKRP